MAEEDWTRGQRNLHHNAVRSRDESGFKVVNMAALVPGYEEPHVMADQVGQEIFASN